MNQFSRFQDEEEEPKQQDTNTFDSFDRNSQQVTKQAYNLQLTEERQNKVNEVSMSKNNRRKYLGVSEKEISDGDIGLINILTRPINDALVFEFIMMILKISRILLVMSLLVKLFLELTCNPSNIHALLVCAFMRDIVSGLFDLKCIFTLSSLRVKLLAKSIDVEVKEMARHYLENSHKIDGRYEDMRALGNSSNSYANNGQHSLIQLLRGCYHFLFFVSLIFVLEQDDEVFCHVFEKYSIIYLFIPYYILLLIVAAIISMIGIIPSVVIVISVILLVRTIYRRYRLKKNLSEFRTKANQLSSILLTQQSNKFCSLCQCNYLLDELSTQLSCQPLPHHFHHACITKWVSAYGNCPICVNNSPFIN